MNASRKPLDFDELQKGSLIPQDICAHAVGCDPSDYKRYSLKLMSLVSEIESRLADRNLFVTVRREGDALRILEDSSAAEYNDLMFHQGMRTMRRRLTKQMQVDGSQLDEDQAAEHKRNIIVNGRIYQAAKDAKREALKLEAHSRKVPAIGN